MEKSTKHALDPELEESLRKAVEAARKSGTHLYPYKKLKK